MSARLESGVGAWAIARHHKVRRLRMTTLRRARLQDRTSHENQINLVDFHTFANASKHGDRETSAKVLAELLDAFEDRVRIR